MITRFISPGGRTNVIWPDMLPYFHVTWLNVNLCDLKMILDRAMVLKSDVMVSIRCQTHFIACADGFYSRRYYLNQSAKSLICHVLLAFDVP